MYLLLADNSKSEEEGDDNEETETEVVPKWQAEFREGWEFLKAHGMLNVYCLVHSEE
jgi:hypothetical protein